MKNFLLVAGLLFCAAGVQAGPFGLVNRRGGSSGNPRGAQAAAPVFNDGELFSAQGVANRMARLCKMAHMGNPTGGFEGVGCATSPAAALANTCKPHGGSPRDWGVAQGSNGLWYACRRW
jgi:hypothetical protein